MPESRFHSVARFIFFCLFFAGAAIAQTIHVPGGTVGNISGSSIGIGTSSPTSLLEIVSSVPVLTITGGDNSALRGIAIRDGSTTFATLLAKASNGEFQLSAGFSGWGGFQTFYTDGAERLRITAAGNVGIGTITPLTLLSVGKDHDGNSGISISNYHAGSAAAGVLQFNNSTRDIAGFLAQLSPNFVGYGGGNSLNLVNVTSAPLAFGTNNTIRMTVDGVGNVGIGTQNPGAYKLAVNGTIRAKEVVVDTGWSDYVFAADYRLAPLDEVEAHIRDKRHLPGIPSAAEVEAGGVSIGYMQSSLLAKVEELTLHLIAQGKRLERLESENAQLRILVNRSHAEP